MRSISQWQRNANSNFVPTSPRRQAHRLTFEEICSLDPRVRELYELTLGIRKAARNANSFCAINHWHGSPRQHDQRSIRRHLKSLVGPGSHAADPRLASWAAHDTVHRVLWDALPGCRGCVCCGDGDTPVNDPPLLFDAVQTHDSNAAQSGFSQ